MDLPGTITLPTYRLFVAYDATHRCMRLLLHRLEPTLNLTPHGLTDAHLAPGWRFILNNACHRLFPPLGRASDHGAVNAHEPTTPPPTPPFHLHFPYCASGSTTPRCFPFPLRCYTTGRPPTGFGLDVCARLYPFVLPPRRWCDRTAFTVNEVGRAITILR